VAVRSIPIKDVGWRRLQELVSLLTRGVQALFAGRGLSVAPKVVTAASPPAMAAKATELYRGPPQDHGTVTFPLTALSCGAGDGTVKTLGSLAPPFGVDAAELEFTAPTPGRTLHVAATATLSITGRFDPAIFIAGPQQGDRRNGTLAVDKTGAARLFTLQLQGLSGCDTETASGSSNCSEPPSSPSAEFAPTLYLAAAAPLSVRARSVCSTSRQERGDAPDLPGGTVNVLAWESLIQYNTRAQGLGRNPSLGQVEGSSCPQYPTQSRPPPVGAHLYKIVAAYQGWHFAATPSTIVVEVGR